MRKQLHLGLYVSLRMLLPMLPSQAFVVLECK